ncbi:3-phosphoshikimate 1-carboxyvinyltransferase [Streptomyces sp. NPDC057302]|uniref:3-phosphoshikimate 1-carboxyvinyltransferase n=1 Tax=Streptomyces sp. NPDC057302 TaxID=3346094 RepID=UPI00362991FA
MEDFLQYKEVHVHPVGKLGGTLTPPASKSYSARAVLAATLAPGTSRIDNLADSLNVRAMMDCCEALGARIRRTDTGAFDVTGPDRLRDGTTLSPGNSGIVLRLLLGATAHLRRTTFMTPYVESLGRRSNQEMVDALRTLGVRCTLDGDHGRLPITLDGSGVHGGTVAVSGRRSSQFLSGLLYLGALLDAPLEVRVDDELKARPMVRTTLRVLRSAGIRIDTDEELMHYRIPADTGYHPAQYVVGSDPASTAALLAVAAAVDSSVEIRHNGLEELGGVLEYLAQIGVPVTAHESSLKVHGGGDLGPCDFDGSKAPDAVLPLAALAAHADGTSRFYNIEHLRYKECDRISDFRRELQRAGISAEEERDTLIVHGSRAGSPGDAVVDSHYDHAVVMAMSVIALRSRSGMTISDPQYVAQTYPGFFDDLQRVGGTVTA